MSDQSGARMRRNELTRYRSLLTAQLQLLSPPRPDQAKDLRLRDGDKKLIARIQDALRRIEVGTFGTCERCGQAIERERLRARPVASQCEGCRPRPGP